MLASSSHTGAWLQALPIPELGLHVDDEVIRTSVALRLGAKVCEPHICRCGAQVDTLGLHGLACLKSAGRWPRHSNLNDIIKRGLEQAWVPAALEPPGLCETDARRPDGVTLYPFSNGLSLTWDATCADTFCQTNIGETAHSPGAAATEAEKRKRNHYSDLASRYRFEPVSVETTGVFGQSTDKFLAELGKRITARTGEKRETEWLRQRISVAIIRSNTASIKATGYTYSS